MNTDMLINELLVVSNNFSQGDTVEINSHDEPIKGILHVSPNRWPPDDWDFIILCFKPIHTRIRNPRKIFRTLPFQAWNHGHYTMSLTRIVLTEKNVYQNCVGYTNIGAPIFTNVR